jgi:transcriptional regulator with XRE-family HTH domain
MFGDKLKEYRNSLGLTQEQLSNKTGISRAIIGMIEAGNRPPSQKVIIKLSEFSNKSIDWWYGKEDEAKDWGNLSAFDALLDYLIEQNLIKKNGKRDDKTQAYINRMVDAEIDKKLAKKYK